MSHFNPVSPAKPMGVLGKVRWNLVIMSPAKPVNNSVAFLPAPIRETTGSTTAPAGGWWGLWEVHKGMMDSWSLRPLWCCRTLQPLGEFRATLPSNPIPGCGAHSVAPRVIWTEPPWGDHTVASLGSETETHVSVFLRNTAWPQYQLGDGKVDPLLSL